MRLITYRLGRQHQQVVDRVDLVMDQAARLAEKHARGSVGRQIADLLNEAARIAPGAVSTQVTGLGFAIRGAGGGFRADTR